MAEQDICVIIPTVRDIEFLRNYFDNARDNGFDLDRIFVVLVTEDFCDTDKMEALLEEEGVSGKAFDGSAREEWFREKDAEEFSHLIPEGSHAETSFGLLYMWANPDFDYGMFIDDDTQPHEDFDFFGKHIENLNSEGEKVQKVESDKDWVNVLYQNYEEHELYPAGYPYSRMNEENSITEGRIDGEVVVSHGLWTNIPDLDSVRILSDGNLYGRSEVIMDKEDYGEDFVVKEGNYLTTCSMNMAFRRQVIPVLYHLPMDDNEWEIGRFQDTWSGLFLKKSADILGKTIYSGDPLCVHNKEPRSSFKSLSQEFPGLELNEHMWEIVDKADEGDSYGEIYLNISDALIEASVRNYNNAGFYKMCGEYMKDWIECLDHLGDE